MAETNRAELLSTVTKRDVDSLSSITEKLFSSKVLADTVEAYNKRQRTELWDGVLGMCMTTLLESNNEETEDAQTLAKMHEIMLCITRLATATLSALKQAKGDTGDEEEPQVEVPSSLQETAIILHGILPTLKSERTGLKNTLCALFESWWNLEIPGREELMANTLLYLLDRSTQLDATKADIGRVLAVHQVLLGVNLGRESAAPLISLLLQCSYHPQYLTSPQGIRFLAFLFTLSPELAQRLHDTIKNHLPSVPAAWGNKYGEIYFRAWHKSAGEQREYLELQCIQDVMHNACRMRMGSKGSLWYALFKILTFLHNKKTQRGVEDMLCRLYEPILWRFLTVCNSEVRLSAAHLMFNAFPLQDSAFHSEEADRSLQRQFDAMLNLLQDPVPSVRVAAVQGVSRVLSIYWELIPLDVIKCFMTTLVEDLAYDITSQLVREAVIKMMHQLCDNHLAMPFLKHVLPSLGNFIHDTSERVRISVLDLLLKLKGLRAIKFYHVVAVEHLLARLEVETSESVGKRIMQLLYRSFVPAQESAQQQLERCKALIVSNPGAARQFFLRLPQFLDVEENVKYTVVLCRYLIENVRHLNSSASQEEDDSGDRDSALSADGDALSGRSSTKRTRTSRGKLSAGNATTAAAAADDDDKNMDPLERQQQQEQVMAVLRGVTEAIYLMYISLSLKLVANPEYRAMSEGLAKKLCVTVREMMAVSQDPTLDTTVIALAGYLPSKALPLACQSLINCLHKLRPEDREGMVNLTSVVKALVQWGKANLLIEMVKESLEKHLAKTEGVNGEQNEETAQPQSEVRKKVKQRKKTVGFSAAAVEESCLPFAVSVQLLEMMLAQPECRPVLLSRHGTSLISLVRSMQSVLSVLKEALSPTPGKLSREGDVFALPDTHPDSIAASVKLYVMYLRLCSFLCCQTGKSLNQEQNSGRNEKDGPRGGGGPHNEAERVREEACRALVTATTWNSLCVLPWLKLASSSGEAGSKVEGTKGGPKGKKGKSVVDENRLSKQKRSQVLSQLLELSLKVVSGVMMAGCARSVLLDEAVQLCMAVLQSVDSCKPGAMDPCVLTASLSCVYQLLSLRVAPEEGENSSQASASATLDSSCKNRYAEVSCSCVCLLLKSLTPSVEDSGIAETAVGKDAALDDSRKIDLLRTNSLLITELIAELTRPGRAASISQKTVVAALDCALSDTAAACATEEGTELDALQLPGLTATVLTAVKRRLGTLKMFCTEIESRLSAENNLTIYQRQALIVLILAVIPYNKTVFSTTIYQALETLVARASCPLTMDKDVFNELAKGDIVKIKELESKVKNKFRFMWLYFPLRQKTALKMSDRMCGQPPELWGSASSLERTSSVLQEAGILT